MGVQLSNHFIYVQVDVGAQFTDDSLLLQYCVVQLLQPFIFDLNLGLKVFIFLHDMVSLIGENLS